MSRQISASFTEDVVGIKRILRITVTGKNISESSLRATLHSVSEGQGRSIGKFVLTSSGKTFLVVLTIDKSTEPSDIIEQLQTLYQKVAAV